MRDHERGAALHHLVEGGLHLALGGGVERARRLVEDQDRRGFQVWGRGGEGGGARPATPEPSSPSGCRSISSVACARSAASRICASVASGLPTRRFSAIERLNSSA